MKVFVTGSTGLLGNHVVRRFLAGGHGVKALVRSRAKAAEALRGLDEVELVEGDMTNIGGFAEAMRGCDVVVNTAAYFREYYTPGSHDDALRAINIDGPTRLMAAALAVGVKRGVEINSSAQVGLEPDGSPGNETTPPDPLVETNLYARSKRDGEAKLRAFSKRSGFPVVYVMPGWMFGPGDLGPTGSGLLISDFLQSRLPAYVEGGTSVADARDVAEVVVAAAERGRAGERYLAAGPMVELKELFGLLEKVSGVKAPRVELPYPLAIVLGTLAQLVSRMTGKQSPLSPQGIRLMRRRLAVDSSKAIAELGAGFRPFEETLRDEVAWIRSRSSGALLTAGSFVQNNQSPVGGKS